MVVPALPRQTARGRKARPGGARELSDVGGPPISVSYAASACSRESCDAFSSLLAMINPTMNYSTQFGVPQAARR